MIVISFGTDELRRNCCEVAAAEEAYGTLDARDLFRLIADAEAAENAQDLIDLMSGAVVAQDDSLVLRFGGNYVALAVPVGNRFGRKSGGGLDWSTVRRLKLTSIERLK